MTLHQRDSYPRSPWPYALAMLAVAVVAGRGAWEIGDITQKVDTASASVAHVSTQPDNLRADAREFLQTTGTELAGIIRQKNDGNYIKEFIPPPNKSSLRSRVETWNAHVGRDDISISVDTAVNKKQKIDANKVRRAEITVLPRGGKSAEDHLLVSRDADGVYSNATGRVTTAAADKINIDATTAKNSETRMGQGKLTHKGLNQLKSLAAKLIAQVDQS